MDYIKTESPTYARPHSAAEFSSSVIESGAVLQWWDGEKWMQKLPDGTIKPAGIDLSGVTAEGSDVRAGKVIVNSAGSAVSGSIQDTTPSSSGGVVTIPAGYLPNELVISAGGGTDVSDTTATAAVVLAGYDFYNASGVKTSGTIQTVTASQSGNTVTVPAGYIASPQTITIGPAIPTNGLVFYAPLSTNAGSAETGQTLTLSGVTFETEFGIPCATFNGSAYISFPNAALPSGTSARTVSIWVRQAAQGNIYLIWHSGGDDDIGLFIDARNGTGHIAAGTADIDITLAPLAAYQYWRHIVIRYASGLAEVFVDGALIGSASITLDTTLDGTAYIGADAPDTFLFNGNIAAVRVYNRALTREEIQILASEFHPAAA